MKNPATAAASECPHFSDGICAVATELADGRPATVTDLRACEVCSQNRTSPRAPNGVTAALAVMATPESERKAKIKELRVHVESTRGTGYELTRMLKVFGWKAEKGKCQCLLHAAIMNDWGPQKCREEFDTIVVWLMEEAEEKDFLMIIINFGGERGVQFGAEQMVRIAIRRAEKVEARLGRS